MKQTLFATALVLSASLTWAQGTPIGYVKTVSGDASVVTGSSSVKAAPGTPLQVGSVLRTGAKSSMGVTFQDNTLMSFGPDTEVAVDDYLYQPGQNKLKLGARVGKGTLNYVSGVIAKLDPAAVSVKTPTGIIGVRGTEFVVKVEE